CPVDRPPPASSTLFPYTTLFRSRSDGRCSRLLLLRRANRPCLEEALREERLRLLVLRNCARCLPRRDDRIAHRTDLAGDVEDVTRLDGHHRITRHLDEERLLIGKVDPEHLGAHRGRDFDALQHEVTPLQRARARCDLIQRHDLARHTRGRLCRRVRPLADRDHLRRLRRRRDPHEETDHAENRDGCEQPAWNPAAFPLVRHGALFPQSTSSMIATSAASPGRWPRWRTRVYPPGRST